MKHANSAQNRDLKKLDDVVSNNFARFAAVSSVNCTSCTSVKLFVCESHVTSVFMTFQNSLASASNFGICDREEEFVDIRTCSQASSHFWFLVFLHLCERNLKLMNICITAPFGTAFPRTVVTQTSVSQESDDVSVFVAKRPTKQKSGLFVTVGFADSF